MIIERNNQRPRIDLGSIEGTPITIADPRMSRYDNGPVLYLQQPYQVIVRQRLADPPPPKPRRRLFGARVVQKPVVQEPKYTKGVDSQSSAAQVRPFLDGSNPITYAVLSGFSAKEDTEALDIISASQTNHNVVVTLPYVWKDQMFGAPYAGRAEQPSFVIIYDRQHDAFPGNDTIRLFFGPHQDIVRLQYTGLHDSLQHGIVEIGAPLEAETFQSWGLGDLAREIHQRLQALPLSESSDTESSQIIPAVIQPDHISNALEMIFLLNGKMEGYDLIHERMNRRSRFLSTLSYDAAGMFLVFQEFFEFDAEKGKQIRATLLDPQNRKTWLTFRDALARHGEVKSLFHRNIIGHVEMHAATADMLPHLIGTEEGNLADLVDSLLPYIITRLIVTNVELRRGQAALNKAITTAAVDGMQSLTRLVDVSNTAFTKFTDAVAARIKADLDQIGQAGTQLGERVTQHYERLAVTAPPPVPRIQGKGEDISTYGPLRLPEEVVDESD